MTFTWRQLLVAQLLLLATIVPGVPAGECAPGQLQHGSVGCNSCVNTQTLHAHYCAVEASQPVISLCISYHMYV
jgi:hypothetical protein